MAVDQFALYRHTHISLSKNKKICCNENKSNNYPRRNRDADIVMLTTNNVNKESITKKENKRKLPV